MPITYIYPNRIASYAVYSCALWALSCPTVVGQVDRQSLLDKKPLAEVGVQSLASAPEESYSAVNPMMYQAEAEDPLSFYVRTQDGEWLIPARVNPEDPWVRLLILGRARPTLVDVAIEINGQPYRAAREQWIDKLLAEAKATFLVRTGVAAAEAIEDAKKTSEEVVESESPNPKTPSPSPSPENEGGELGAEETTDTPPKSKDEIPMVAAQARQTSTLFKRLINYLAADPSIEDHETSREELRWLLAEWTGGPALLTLSPAFSWRRADAAPLWQALDRNGDRMLSRDEIQQTLETFKQADSNRDDIVDLGELQRLAKQHTSPQRTQSHPLVVVIDESTDWKALKKHLRSAFPQRDEDYSNLLSLPADVMFRVSFAKKEAKVTLLAIGAVNGSAATGSDAGDRWRLLSSTGEVITVERPEMYLELSAAQGAIDSENTSGDMQQTQIALGAVVDGFPLFRLLDLDNNRQLTLRERRSVEKLLTTLDRNQDGQIESSEIPTAIRLAVTHGPQVHEHLSQATAVQREQGDQADPTAPAWFVGMDRNQDGDLSKREFQGSPAQFAKFDRDDDGLISRAEIQETEVQ